MLNGERQTGIGELGEVVVRTPHLARYAEERPGTDRPEGPERRTGFTGSPFADRGSEWVYRTGDRARLRPDGLLDYVGRADQQVKVRGFRVEPAEIETALLTLPSVRAAAVLAVPEPGAGHRLVGYLATGGERPDLAAVRRSLAARLADHKVPGSFVVVDTFPLTANGKLDRAGLASLGPEESAVAAHVPPAATASRRSWPRSGPRCCAASGSGRPTTSSHSAATPCCSARCWYGCAASWART